MFPLAFVTILLEIETNAAFTLARKKTARKKWPCEILEARSARKEVNDNIR